MPIPKHYLAGLSKKDRKLQESNIKKAKLSYKKNYKNKNRRFVSRPMLKSFKVKTSRHIVDFYKKYRVKISEQNLPQIERVTGIPTRALKKVIKKGKGAYYSSGSRPNQTAHSWAYARLASFLLGRGAYKIDKNVLDDVDKSKIKIKLPGIGKIEANNKQQQSIKNCCLVSGKNEGQCKTADRVYDLPRRFSRKQCSNKNNIRGFTMKASCTPFLKC